MACAQQHYGDFSIRLFQKALAERIPLSGMLELSYRCNLCCLHCYIPSHTGGGELTTEAWLRLIDEIADAGCLFLLLTGGEPLLHPGFPDVYLHARRKGIVLYVFTNGTHLPTDRLDLLRRHPPCLVDVSLYGATEDTYARITGRREFGRVVEHLRAMRAAGLSLQVKITLLNENLSELDAMVGLVQSLGLPVRLNAVMSCRYDGDATPARHRLTPRQIADCEAAFPSVAAQWRRSFQRTPSQDAGDALYACGAGLNSFAVTPNGRLLLCGTDQKRGVSLRDHGFDQAWRMLGEMIAGLRRRPDHPCSQCEHSSRCLQCAAWAELDMGDEQAVVPYLCELTHRRAQHFAQTSQDGTAGDRARASG